MKIPVFHDDQHGTAIVAGAAVYNGLRIVDKQIGDVKMSSRKAAPPVSPASTCWSDGAQAGTRHSGGSLRRRLSRAHRGHEPVEAEVRARNPLRTLDEAMDGADIFMGLSGPGVLKAESVRKTAPHPLILAMANPTPEIMPEEALAVRPDAILATGRSDYPNQVNNVLCFPFMFRGALDRREHHQRCDEGRLRQGDRRTRAREGGTERSHAGLRRRNASLAPSTRIRKPFDPRLIEDVPLAVVKAAMESGVATRPIEDLKPTAASSTNS